MMQAAEQVNIDVSLSHRHVYVPIHIVVSNLSVKSVLFIGCMDY